MPVDLSMIGLDGIKAGQDTLDAIEARKSMAALTQAQQLENQTTAQEMELDAQAAQMMSQIASGDYKGRSTLFDGAEDDDSSAKLMEIVGDVYMKGGAPKKGMEFLKGASTIRKQEQEINSAKFTDQQKKLENILKVSDLVSRTIGTARNQSEWEYGKAQLKKAGVFPPEQMDAIDQMTEFDPDVAAFFNEQALTAYQRAQLDMTASNQQAQTALAEQRISNAEQMTGIAKERLRLAQIASERAEKQGKSSAAPDTNAIKSVSAAVSNQVFNGNPPKGENKAAFDAGVQSIAARAQAMVKADKALDWDTAVNRAVIESQSQGDWEMYKDEGAWYNPFDTTEKTKFNPTGKDPATAVPLPQTEDGKADPSKLKSGRFYITAKGRAKWDGKKFTLVQGNPAEE